MAFHCCSVSKSVYRTRNFLISLFSVICARQINSSKSSKNLGNSRGREVSNLGASCSLRIGIKIGRAISEGGCARESSENSRRTLAIIARSSKYNNEVGNGGENEWASKIG